MRGTLSGLVGQAKYGDGTRRQLRQGLSGEKIVSINHGRWHEACSRGLLFGYADKETGINAPYTTNSFLNTTTATATPIIGVWNPPTSGVMAVLQKTQITVRSMASGQTDVTGAIEYLVTTNQSAISTGVAGWNLKTLVRSSRVKAFANGIALTGMTGNLTEMFTVGIGNMASQNNTSTSAFPCFTVSSVDFVEGALIVMPGNLLAVMHGSTSTLYTFTGSMIWEEIPL